MTQALFHAGEHCLVVAGFDVDDAIRNEAGLRQRWRTQVGPAEAQEDLASTSGRNPSTEQRGRRPVDGAVTAAGNLVKGA